MSVPPEIFDEDYLYFYADVLGPERSEADAELVARGSKRRACSVRQGPSSSRTDGA